MATQHPQGAEPSRSSRPCLPKAVVWLGLLLPGMAAGAGALGAALCSSPSPPCIAGILNRIQPSASRLLSRFWEQRLLYGKRLKRKQNKFCSEDQILFPSFLPVHRWCLSRGPSEVSGCWADGAAHTCIPSPAWVFVSRAGGAPCPGAARLWCSSSGTNTWSSAARARDPQCAPQPGCSWGHV